MSLLHGTSLEQFLRETYAKVNDDNVFNGAAALGFYLTIAIFPAAILVLSLVPYLPIPRVDQAIMDLLHQALPRDAAQMFTTVVDEVAGQQQGGLVSTGALGTLWATSTGMYAIMQQLNITSGVKESRGFIHARLVALGLSLLFSALMLVAFSLIVLGGVAQDWLGDRFGFSAVLLVFFAAARWVIIVMALLLAFSLTYYLAPNVEGQTFAFFTVGSSAATLLLMLASVGFAIYVQSFAHYSAVYGGIGAVVALMLWLYIAGLSLLIGSIINVLIEHHAPEGMRGGGRARGAQDRHAAGHKAAAPPRRYNA